MGRRGHTRAPEERLQALASAQNRAIECLFLTSERLPKFGLSRRKPALVGSLQGHREAPSGLVSGHDCRHCLAKLTAQLSPFCRARPAPCKRLFLTANTWSGCPRPPSITCASFALPARLSARSFCGWRRVALSRPSCGSLAVTSRRPSHRRQRCGALAYSQSRG